MKSMYIKHITYSSLASMGPHLYDSWNITKQKKIEKIMQCPYTKYPPLWYGSVFFPKNMKLLCIHIKQMHFFIMKLHPKTLN